MSNRKEDSKTRILEAARACFSENGYNNTSVRQICEAADTNLALVSYYFGSKENLYYAVIEKLRSDIGRIFAANGRDDDPEEALYDFLQHFQTLRRENKLFHTLLKHELSAEGPLRDAVKDTIAPCFERLRAIIAQGKERGVFHYESLEQVLMFISSILVYPAYDSLLASIWSSSLLESEQELERAAEFILAGLKQQKRSL